MPVESYKSLGHLLKNRRNNKDLSQEELASKVGTTNSHVSKWERNKNIPSEEYLRKLAKELSIPEEVLIDQIRMDKYGHLDKIAEPFVNYGDKKTDIIKNLEAIQHLIKITIDKLKEQD